MAINPEILTGLGTISGIALGIAGKILHSKVMNGTNGNGNGNGQKTFCQEHHHLAKEVTALCADMKAGFNEVRSTQLQMAKDIAHISGFIKGEMG